MMLSSEYIQLKICKTFCQTPWNGFDFDDEIWFENGLKMAASIVYNCQLRYNLP